MEDQMKEKSSEKKKIIVIVAVIIILSIIFFAYSQIFSMPSGGVSMILSQSDCQIQMKQWCNNCYSINDNNINVWNIGGSRIGEAFAKCSNQYYQTDWTSEQDCKGNAIDYCLPQIDLPIE